MPAVYCYHCRKSHSKEEMRLLVTKTGKRWRCIHSIEAAKKADIATRDNFGKKMSDANRERMLALRRAQQVN